MQKTWISTTATLLAIFDAVQEQGSVERSGIDRRTGSFRPGWPVILTRLTAMEAAMLQDLAWWGPQMERRLTQLTDVRTTTQTTFRRG